MSAAWKPTFRSGRRACIGGTKWEVIGYVEKKDASLLAFWDEYLLFNPYFGFRFLVQSDNHWSLARIIKRDVALAGSAQRGVARRGTVQHVLSRNSPSSSM